MKKNQVNEILINQTRRRNVLFGLFSMFMLFLVISGLFFLVYNERNKGYFVNYDEDSSINYKVMLKENEFFDTGYLSSNKQYIASLIDYIDANFNYQLSLDEDVEYKYSYRIESQVVVKEKGSNNSLYEKSNVIKNIQELTSNRIVNIRENIDIDYNYYNDLIKKFVNVYDLDNVESTLNINMYVNLVGSCEEFIDNQEKESVMSLSIPLTTKTIGIDISDNLINSENNVMYCKDDNGSNIVILLVSIMFLIVSFVFVVVAVRYEIVTRTAENIYERELKKILNNYSSYIQTLDSEFDFKDYQLLKLNTFTDMLEIRDTVRQPILMKENANKTGAYFVIPTSSKILYVYRLKVSDIEKKINKDNMEEI